MQDRTDEAGELFPVAYEHLHSLASAYLSQERCDHTLQPTALVHEAYLRLNAGEAARFDSREHFLGVAARAMRRVLVDHARRKRSAKRGGGGERLHLDAIVSALEERALDLGELDEALERLESFDPRGARVVELRFFAGLEHEEAARVLGVSEKTVRRSWEAARLWLRKELEAGR